MPAPAIAAAVLRGVQAMRAAGVAWKEERAMAKKAKDIKTALKVKSEMQSKTESAVRLAKKLKQLKRIGWLIKGITLTTSSFGDIFISIWILLFWANMELIVFPILIPWWKQEWWEKAATIALDLIVFVIIMIIAALFIIIFMPGDSSTSYIKNNPIPFGTTKF